jgi:glycosyltransferase involved in cell wall biosynthesis
MPSDCDQKRGKRGNRGLLYSRVDFLGILITGSSVAEQSKIRRRILIIVENLPSPFDRRVWQEATTLQKSGYDVSIICPTGKGYEKRYEVLEDVHIYRHPLPIEASSPAGYLIEYSAALFWEFVLATRVAFTRGFDVIHACNPPDLIFLVGGFFRIFGKKFVFDHHDVNPELYEAKFGRRDFYYKLTLLLERFTFRIANISIATNESYKKIAIERGGMPEDRVHVVRSGPKLERLQIMPPNPELRKGCEFLVGYVGVMGDQEGIDYLLHAARYIVHDLGQRNIHFGLVGGGTSLESLKALAVELEIEDFVTFTGRVPDEMLLEMLNTADVCVNPDVANDMNDKSTMNKIMEYMALKKPIVQFDLTEGRFSAQDASVYARNNDSRDMAHKIVELLNDPARRAQMGEFGYRRVVDGLSWEYEEPKLLRAYEQLFSRS